jgi:hypothetical protein
VGSSGISREEKLYEIKVDRVINAGDLAALDAHLKRMIELKKRVEVLNRELLPNTQKLEAEWYVLEARLWLERAKAK